MGQENRKKEFLIHYIIYCINFLKMFAAVHSDIKAQILASYI
jgi:hypothetical protein